MDPKSTQRANPPNESVTTPAVALTVVLTNPASAASLNASRARSHARAPRANRFTRYAPSNASRVLPAAIAAEVATEPAVVMLTRKAPARIAGHTS